MKKADVNCDVTIGSWDGAEVCELVRLYLLSQLQNLNIIVGLYRDDGLGAATQRPQQVESIKKKICQVFRDNGLKISIEANKKIVNFLDVTLDLNHDCFKPYVKPNSPIIYVNNKSNHPPCILKNIPLSVNKRLAELSSTEEIFNNSVKEYQTALDKCGYSHKLEYTPVTYRVNRRSRKRKVVWFNPPWSKNVKTDIGKAFFKPKEDHFPENHILRPVINKNSVKLSYSCMANVGSIISQHNRKVLMGAENTPTVCNCENGECPVEGKCGLKGIIYQATLKYDGDKKDTYVGLTERKFIERHKEHLTNFENRHQKSTTKLSKKVWNLKEKNKNYELKWEILKKARPYNSGDQECRLCLAEMLIILFQPEKASLNSRSEIFNKCRHQNKFKLSKF